MYVEYLKLSDKDKKEYKNYAIAEVEKYKKLALKAEKKSQELQEELNQEKAKYRNLKNKTN